MVDRGTAKKYLMFHVCMAVAVALFPLYRWLTSDVLSLSGCFLHDYLCLYCAFCGGTRSLTALLRFDFASAFAYNALVPLLVLFAMALDIVALVRLCKGKKHLLTLPKWSWLALVIVLVGYAILRNYLMIVYGYDPVGELLAVWHR